MKLIDLHKEIEKNQAGCGNKNCKVCYPNKEPRNWTERIIQAQSVCRDIIERIEKTIR